MASLHAATTGYGTGCQSAHACSQTMPNPELSAEQAVAVQLEALMNNDQPWPAHGVQTCYEFGEGIGGLEPCWYHLDHFAGQFANAFPHLINAEGYKIAATRDLGEARTMVEVAVVPGGGRGEGPSSVVFALRRKTVGSNKGAWLTKMLLPGTLDEAMQAIQDMLVP